MKDRLDRVDQGLRPQGVIVLVREIGECTVHVRSLLRNLDPTSPRPYNRR